MPRRSRASLNASAVNSAGSSTAIETCRPLGGRRAPGANHRQAGAAFQARLRLFAGRGGLHAVVHRKVVHIRRPFGQRMAAPGRTLDDVQLVSIFVEGERRNRCAVAPLQIVPAPPLSPGLVKKVSVVAHHAAFHRAHARLLHLLRKQIERRHQLQRPRGLCGLFGRDLAARNGRRSAIRLSGPCWSCPRRSCLRLPRVRSGSGCAGCTVPGST